MKKIILIASIILSTNAWSIGSDGTEKTTKICFKVGSDGTEGKVGSDGTEGKVGSDGTEGTSICRIIKTDQEKESFFNFGFNIENF